MPPKLSRFRSLIILFVLINIILFLTVARTPIRWQQPELAYYHLYWSAQGEGGDPFLLKSGLGLTDFAKIFESEQTDGWFRARHFSYLTELLSFKMKQSLSFVSFQDPALIIFHLLNCGLLFVLLIQMTRNRLAATLGAVLALNSGIAFSTLLFPFRNAKLLIMTLFLSGWISVLTPEGTFPASRRRQWLFFATFFLALFTDELGILLYGLLVVQMILTRQLTRGHLGPFMVKLALTAGAYLILKEIFFIMDVRNQSMTGGPLFPIYISQLMEYYQTAAPLRDVPRAIVFHFLRYALGYWALSFWGVIAFLAFLGIVFFSLKQTMGHHQNNIHRTIILIILFIVAKACVIIDLLPPWEYLKSLNITFPSISFYHYYYTYPDALLLCLALGLSLNAALSKGPPQIILIFLCATLINISNAQHKQLGVEKILSYHGYYQSHRQAIPHVLAIKKMIAGAGGSPMYLSFPSGSQPVFKRRLGGTNLWQDDHLAEQQQLHPDFVNYASIIPVQFLKRIERGELIISLKNAPTPYRHAANRELDAAAYFYDVPLHQGIDLANIRRRYGKDSLIPLETEKKAIISAISLSTQQSHQHCIFFIKGAARITLAGLQKTVVFQQRYGTSYQLFHFPMDEVKPSWGEALQLHVTPIREHESVHLIGPFTINDQAGLRGPSPLAKVLAEE